jgi:hypothetical protein
MRWIIGIALLLRLAVFPFAENKHGDSPMRALIAERMNLDPPTAADPRTYCQFGPLHTTLMRAFLAIDPDAPRSSRYLSLLAGLAVFFPFLRLARRLSTFPSSSSSSSSAPPPSSSVPALAALALAVSPLHIQASTTAASEALYLFLMVACLERLLAALDSGALATFALAGLLASLAAVTRYDAWLAFPIVVVAALLLTGPRRALPGLLVFSIATAALPLAWIIWGARSTDDPLFFAHYISADHASLAAAVNLRVGPLVARVRQLAIWSISFLAVMSLPMLIGGARALRRFARLAPAARLVAIAALAPPAIYLTKGLLFLSFEPFPRFALIPGTLLLPLAASALLAPGGGAPRPRRWAKLAAAVSASALGFSALVLVAAWSGPRRVWVGAESLGALTRLDGEDRQLADYLRAHRRPAERVFIEPLDFSDIVIAHAARIPAELTVSLAITRSAEATVAATLARTGARWLAAYDGGPTTWGQTLAADWPAESLRFGHWKLIRADGPEPRPEKPGD